MSAHPYIQAVQEAGKLKIQEAAEIMKFNPTTQTAPGVYTDATGHPTFAPAPRVFTDQHGNTGAVGPGGAVTPLASNPSGVTGNDEMSNAVRILVELGPSVLAHTAPPEDIAKYNLAATTYQHLQTRVDPATKGLISLPDRPLPPGMPQPGPLPPGAPQPHPASPSGRVATPAQPPPPMSEPGSPPVPVVAPAAPPGPVTAPGSPPQLTGSPRGPDAAQAVTEHQMMADADEISKDQALTLKDHAIMGTSQTIRSMLPQVTQGTGAEQRLKLAQVFQSMGFSPQTVQSWTGTGAAPGEILQKKLFELSTGAERAAMGARGSASVVGMFTRNYPGMTSQNMTTDAMTRLLDMDQVYKENEIAGRQQYLAQQVQGVAQNKPYGGLANYQQPDPRVYQAAALASGGMPYSAWTTGLSDQQKTAALQLAAKVYPDATALGPPGPGHPNGVPHRFQPPSQMPSAAPGGGGG
jgi:hypothetical protein